MAVSFRFRVAARLNGPVFFCTGVSPVPVVTLDELDRKLLKEWLSFD